MENLKKRHQRINKEKNINNFELYRIVVLIALLIIFGFISIREIRWFNKAKC